MTPRSDHSGRVAASLLVLGVTILAAGCGPAPSARLDPARNRLPLDAWVTVIQDEQAGVRPAVRVAAPHRSLVFRRDGERYHSGLEVRVTAWRGDVQVGGGVGEARVVVNGYQATGSEVQLEVTAPLLIRGDEAVTLDVAARVLESSRGWVRQLSFSPRALATMPVWIAAVRALPQGTSDGGDLIEADGDSLRLQVTLQRRRGETTWPESGLSLVSEVTGAAGGELLLQRQPVPDDLAPGERRLVPSVWPAAQLPFGHCRLQMLVELLRDGEWLRLPHEPALELVNLRVPVADDDAWREHLDWLEGKLATARRDSLQEIAAPARPAAWAAIWRDLGASAGQSAAAAERQHLRRVVAADDRYGGHGRGAESDRGRTLIRWGEPARIDSYADTRAAGAVWEVWEYPQRNLRLYFFDAHGIGDYRLRREEALVP